MIEPAPPKDPTTSPLLSPRSTAIVRFFIHPPFLGLPVLVWLYFVWCFLVHPGSPIMHGNLPDGDDYMYLNQIQDWLNGQGWFDNTQYRLDSSNHVPIDFSRITQLPMAVLIKILAPLLGQNDSALLMAALWPIVLFALLLKGLSWASEPLMSYKYSRLTSYLALFATYLLYQFSPGHIDHHGLTALLVLLGYGSAVRMFHAEAKLQIPIYAGLFLSLALVVGLEVLPPLIVISSWIGLWGIAKGREAAKSGMIFGVTLFVSSLIYLIITTPPHRWLIFDPLGYSLVYVIFTAALALCYSGVFLASLTRFRWLRLCVGGSLALVSGIVFLHCFPTLIGGPYGAMNKELAHFMFSIIPEAIPIFKKSTSGLEYFLRLLWPAMACAAGFWQWKNSDISEKRWATGLSLVLLMVSILLAVFYQIRFMVFAQLFSIIPLAALLPTFFSWIASNSSGRVRSFLELEVLVLIAPLPMLILPALIDGRPFNTGIILFPVASAEYSCDMHSAAMALNDKNLYGAKPHLIMNDIAYGPELLFRTSNLILSAPFHTDVEGNLIAKKFFSTTDSNEAEHLIRASKADLVIMCRKTVPLYDIDNNAHMKTFAQQLDAGIVPPWLEPIHYKEESDFMLFSVKSQNAN